MITKAVDLNPNFDDLSDNDKLVFVFSDKEMATITAKTCYTILQLRYNFLYKWVSCFNTV